MAKRGQPAQIPVEPAVSPLLTTSDVALQLRRSPDTIREWRADGHGPAHYRDVVTGAVWYRQADVDAWLDTLRVETLTPD
jgi:hypothetical protein